MKTNSKHIEYKKLLKIGGHLIFPSFIYFMISQPIGLAMYLLSIWILSKKFPLKELMVVIAGVFIVNLVVYLTLWSHVKAFMLLNLVPVIGLVLYMMFRIEKAMSLGDSSNNILANLFKSKKALLVLLIVLAGFIYFMPYVQEKLPWEGNLIFINSEEIKYL